MAEKNQQKEGKVFFSCFDKKRHLFAVLEMRGFEGYLFCQSAFMSNNVIIKTTIVLFVK